MEFSFYTRSTFDGSELCALHRNTIITYGRLKTHTWCTHRIGYVFDSIHTGSHCKTSLGSNIFHISLLINQRMAINSGGRSYRAKLKSKTETMPIFYFHTILKTTLELKMDWIYLKWNSRSDSYGEKSQWKQKSGNKLFYMKTPKKCYNLNKIKYKTHMHVIETTC